MRTFRLAAVCLLGVVLLGPVSAPAAERQDHADISITRDAHFDRAHGVRSGRGTTANPYVISGWLVGNLTIKDTTKAVRIVDNTIFGTLTLNWNGRAVEVHDNDVGDLRVNENVPRWGAPTSGVIAHNRFNLVGQLRHFDGMFMHNTVGAPQETLAWPFSGSVVNFDGFNGAHFAHNTIYGYVNAQLHGHHHSSGYAKDSHMHSGHADAMADHSRRYHQVFIEYNRIITNNSSYALGYTDGGHSQNDRTAASETNPNLNAPHVHYTRVSIKGNRLEGGGVYVGVFNSPDEYHRVFAPGYLEIVANHITLQKPQFPYQSLTGIQLHEARSLTLRIDRNTILAPAPPTTNDEVRKWEFRGSGIQISGVDRARVLIGSNRVTNLYYGIWASRMNRNVNWGIARVIAEGVVAPVYYDSSVANRPRMG